MSIVNKLTIRRRLKKCVTNTCGIETVKKRLPVLQWLPKYSFVLLMQDIIAGITVALTAIPQGIAYAVVAGLSPEYGLYSGIMGGLVYVIFGSCKDVTVGPTAILAAMTSKYVSGNSSDFAVLAAFVAGVVELAMGVLQLGFLVEFISVPVISGFTTAAALQIASAQLKGLLGLSGPSGNYFAASLSNFFQNIKTIKLWDTVLGFATIAGLYLLKKIGQGCKRTDNTHKRLRWFIALGRNAIVVIIGIIIAYIIKATNDTEPLELIGNIGSGLPTISPPPFSTIVGNETYNFQDMMQVLGPQFIILPLVSILELVAIAKVFATGNRIDATQEMIALGFCNIIGSFARSMPTTGSFTRTALNNASGVQTTAGGIVTGLIIILALSLLTSTFYYIPRASLAGLIIMAMFSMIDFGIFIPLWRKSKRELLVICLTIIVCLGLGLEFGITAGIALEALFLLYDTARPSMEVRVLSSEKGKLVVVKLSEQLAYSAAEHVRRVTMQACASSRDEPTAVLIVDGSNVKTIDFTVASNLLSLVDDVERSSCQIVYLNFKSNMKNLCLEINPKYENKFMENDSTEYTDCVPKLSSNF